MVKQGSKKFSWVIRQKGKSQNEGNKKTKHAKNEHFLPTDARIRGYDMLVFRKFWRALFSCYLCFEIHLFVLLTFSSKVSE